MIDNWIFEARPHGGINRIWQALKPALTDVTDSRNVFMSTYYQPAPKGMKEVVMFYDPIPLILPSERERGDVAWILKALKRAACIVAISKWSASYANSLNRSVDTHVVYPALVPTPYQDLSEQWQAVGLPDKFFLMVGNRSLYKNAHGFYQAYPYLTEQLPVVAVGGTMSKHDLDFAARYPQKFIQTDMSDTELRYAYSRTTALIYPSWFEGFGYPALEALAYGTPLVTSNGGGLDELVGGAAFTCDPYQPRDIAQIVNRVIGLGYAERLAYQERAVRQASSFIGWERPIAQLTQIIEAL